MEEHHLIHFVTAPATHILAESNSLTSNETETRWPDSNPELPPLQHNKMFLQFDQNTVCSLFGEKNDTSLSKTL